MVDSWATFASFLTEDDSLILPSPEFGDDDPSSYLLYPPGFGPAGDWLVGQAPGRSNLPVLAGEVAVAADPDESGGKGAGLVVDAGRKGATMDGSGLLRDKSEFDQLDCGVMSVGERCSDGSGVLELLGLSEALSGKVSLVGGSDSGGVLAFSCAADCGGKDGVDEYMVMGNLERNVDGENGVCGHGGNNIDVSRTSGASFSGEGAGSAVRRELATLKDDGNALRESPPFTTHANVEDHDDVINNLGTGGPSESESDDSSSSSSSSSSEESSEQEEEEEDDDDDDDGYNGDERDESKVKKMDGIVDLEEGEIRDLDAEEVDMSSDGEDDRAKGPIRSKHELEVLPTVPPVNVTLEPHHQMLPVGVISSILGTKVIVEGLEKHNPLNEGSILWLTETRSPLGLVDEIFGPVKNPYYVIRFNSEKEIPAGIREGTTVSFVIQFANHILNEPALYKKGYDASGENDEEVSDEEFSDDEKEAEHKRSLRQTKRGTEDRRQRPQESIGKKRAQFDKRRQETKTTGFRNRKDVQALAPSALAPISQPLNIPSQLQSTLRQHSATSVSAPISQPPNVPTRFQSTLRQPLGSSGSARVGQPLNAQNQHQQTLRKPSVHGASAPISQPTNVPSQLQSTLRQPWGPSGSARIGQTSNVQSQYQQTLQKPSVHGASISVSQPTNVPSQLQSTLQKPFIPRQVQASPQPPFVPGHVQAPVEPPSVLGQVQVLPQQMFIPVQVPAPAEPPCVPGQVQAPHQPPCVPGQLQALLASLQQACAPGQLQLPTLPPYVQGPFQATTSQPCVPGPLQAPPVASNVGCGDFTGSSVSGDAYLNCPPTVPAIPSGGQPGGPSGVAQQNLLMPQSNAVWAHGVSTQQFITGLLSMLQNNGMPCQQLQDHGPFNQNQNHLFPSFSNGMPFQHQFTPNPGIPPTMSWQSGPPNPSIGPASLDPPMQDSHGQARPSHRGTGEQRTFGLSDGDQNSGQSQTAMGQGDMHAAMKFSMGTYSSRGRRPYGRGGG